MARRRIKTRNPNAMIVVEKTKKRVIRYLKPYLIPENSFERKYNGGWLHILGLDKENNFWAIDPLSAEKNRLPTDLFMAKHCAEEVNDVYGLSMPMLEKIKIGIFVGLIIANLIVVFLIAAAAGGA